MLRRFSQQNEDLYCLTLQSVPGLIEDYFSKENPFPQSKNMLLNKMKKLIFRLKRSFLNVCNVENRNKKELSRLKNIPRYTPGSSSLLGGKFDYVDATTFVSGYKEIIEGGIYEFTSKKKDPIIIDCGANIGLSVYYFKKIYPDAVIKAYEPDPNIFKVLSRNIKYLNFKDVALFQEAIWKENGNLTFHIEGGFSGRIPKKDDDNNLVEVPCRRLKDLLESKVDFLKIDIEGAEYEVLKDIQYDLNNVENIFIEYHSHMSESQTLSTILEILKNSGFRYHLQEAFVRRKPFVGRDTMLGMDLQLNIFGYKLN